MANESKKKKVTENKEAKKVQDAEKVEKKEVKTKKNQEPKATKKAQTSKKEKTDKNKRSFGKDFKAELKKVIWPTPKELVNSTIAVITIVLVTAIIVLVLDLGFELITKHGINNLKAVVENNNQEITNQIDSNNTIDTNSVVDAVVENTVQ